MRRAFVVLCLLGYWMSAAIAQVSVGIGLPGVNIGINLPVYPELVRIPGYPVYYAPQASLNYFFYDGLYWVYQDDNWYASSWYNGPWGLVDPAVVPLFVLRVPVRYYERPPVYFRGWRADAPPRWGEHWGGSWEQHRRGWDNWNRSSVPAPAPLPVYQKQYSGDRYPRGEQQQALQLQNYHYQPRDAAVRQQTRAQSAPTATPPRTQAATPSGPSRQQEQRSANRPASQQGTTSAERRQVAPNASQEAQRAVIRGPQQNGPATQARQQPSATERQPRQAQAESNRPQNRAAAQEPRPQPQQQQVKQQRAQPQQQRPQPQQAAQGQGRSSQESAPKEQPRQRPDKGADKGENKGDRNNN